MKSLVLTLLLAAAALAQVPAKSLINGLTIEVVDIDVPVPYGAAETKAVVSVCSDQQFSKLQLFVASQAPTGEVESSAVFELSAVKATTGYCASVVAPAARAKLTQLDASSNNEAHVIAAPKTPAATSENRAGKRRF